MLKTGRVFLTMMTIGIGVQFCVTLAVVVVLAASFHVRMHLAVPGGSMHLFVDQGRIEVGTDSTDVRQVWQKIKFWSVGIYSDGGGSPMTDFGTRSLPGVEIAWVEMLTIRRDFGVIVALPVTLLVLGSGMLTSLWLFRRTVRRHLPRLPDDSPTESGLQ